jgi:hypothetical protein
MPTVSKGGHGHMNGQTNQNSEHTREQVAERARPAFARDDLKGAYAGIENESTFKSEDHPTKLKARRTKKSSTRTPKM